MGIFCLNCDECESNLDLIEPIKEEIQIQPYYSKGDSIVKNFKEHNLFKSITLVEYMNFLLYINNESINNNFEGPFKMEFSYSDSEKILNEEISYELFEFFLSKMILSHRVIGEKETIFLDMCLEIYKVLQIKLREHYDDNNTQITKKDLIGLGLFFCKGADSYKIKLIFDLFKNNKNQLVKNRIFDEFLLCNFLIGSYCLLCTRKNMSRINPLVSEIFDEKEGQFMNAYDLKNCENLVEYFDYNFFYGMKLTFYEYKLNFKEFNGFGWIFSPEGIRQKLEENKYIE